MLMEQLTNIAIKAALKAGAAIMEIYEQEDFDVDFKADNSPLTKADMASHEVIVSYLEKTNIPILSEEGKTIPYSTRSQWKTLWIVDPIDGTKEFIKRNGEFTVNIALVTDGVPVLGVIYVPVLGQLYFANHQIGSYKTTRIIEQDSVQNWMAKADKLPYQEEHPYTVVASRSHLSKETEDFIGELKAKYGQVNIISKGSSLKLCLVAEGFADCYPRFAPTMEWDTAAGHAICKYAGKSVIDWELKNEMIYNRENLLNSWFLVR